MNARKHERTATFLLLPKHSLNQCWILAFAPVLKMIQLVAAGSWCTWMDTDICKHTATDHIITRYCQVYSVINLWCYRQGSLLNRAGAGFIIM